MTRVRDWLRTESGREDILGGTVIYNRYLTFRSELPRICTDLKLDVNDLTFVDLSYTIATWLKEQG
ncbi:MAG TPA: hypothetical protein VGS96_05785 [Thermoanaerobaculia bacterium]|nr:hypothetical protein [Thermoanaerobaculia bacterium]